MGEKIQKTQSIDIRRLSESEKRSLALRLYQIFVKVVAAPGFEEFYQFHFSMKPTDCARKIGVYYNEKQEMVGFLYLQINAIKMPGRLRRVMVCKSTAAVFPEYRQHRTTLYFSITETIKAKCRYFWRPFFYAGMLIHPAPYHLFASLHWRLYPSYRVQTPKKIVDFIHGIALEVGYKVVAVKEGVVIASSLGFQVKSTDQEKIFWHNHISPHVQFYLKYIEFEDNPLDQKALVTFYPLSVIDMAVIFFKQMVQSMKKKWRTHKEKVRLKSSAK